VQRCGAAATRCGHACAWPPTRRRATTRWNWPTPKAGPRPRACRCRPRLRVLPATLRLAAAAGAKASAELLLENRGNVPVEIGAVLVAGLFDDDGIEAAMAAAYNLEAKDVNQIVGHAFERLRQAHGGLLKLRVLRGAGVLAVGERRLLEIETRLGAKLAAGHGYHGVLELAGHGIAVEVQMLRKPSGVKT
jgi:hypothetical protein